MRFFQRDALFVTDQPVQEVRGESTAGEELSMRTTIGHTREGVVGAVDHIGHVLSVKAFVGAEELDVQIASQGQVEHYVNRRLVFLFGDLAEGFAHVFFEFGLVVYTLDEQAWDGAADTSLNDLEPPVGLFGFAFDSFTQGWVFDLFQLFLLSTSRQFAPGWAGIVQVPVFQGKGKACPDGPSLTINGQTLGTTAFDPLQATLMDFGVLAGRDNRVMQNRPSGCGCQFFQEDEVFFNIARGLGGLNETISAFIQYLSQVENVCVSHCIGDHRGAIIIGLGRVWA